MTKNTFGVIGLARRAGKAACGAESAIEAVRKGKARLVLVASDVSENTRKTLFDKSAYYNVRCEQTDVSMADLGRSVGTKKSAAVVITDDNFVKAYEKSLSADLNKE